MGAVPMVFFISNVSFNKFTDPPTKKTEQIVFASQDGIHCDAFLLYIVYHIFVDECGSA